MSNSKEKELLRAGLAEIIHYRDNKESWEQFKSCSHHKVMEVLNALNGIEFSFIDGYLVFNQATISSEESKKYLQCYKKIVSSLVYPDWDLFDRVLPKIKAIVGCEPITSVISITEFIKDISSIRDTSRNRTLLIMNDRGRKYKYVQTFNYQFKDLAQIETKYENLNSVYKNWVLYEAYNSLYIIDKLLLKSLAQYADWSIDILNDEEELWGCIMVSVTLLEKILLLYPQNVDRYSHQKYPSSVRYLLQYALYFIALYLIRHEGKDALRLSECHTMRARIVDRFYYHDLDGLIDIFQRASNSICDPVIFKYLYIYDMHSASELIPYEFEKKYDYWTSAHMMYQNRQVSVVLPEGGDSFETSYETICKIGKRISQGFGNEAIYRYKGVHEALLSKFSELKDIFNVIFQKNAEGLSPYRNYYAEGIIKELRKPDSQVSFRVDVIRCISYVHQTESYSRYGKVKADFIPIFFSKVDFLERVKKNNIDETFSIQEKEDRTLIQNVHIYPKCDCSVNSEEAKIRQLLILNDNDKNITSIRCYGSGLRSLKRYIDWYHLFLGIPVRVVSIEDYAFPETLSLLVCLQKENDL